MNLPNILTVSRLFLTVFFLLVIQRDGLIPKVLAAVIFAVASLTDFFDGYLAKKKNLITDFGKIMDPIADKFLMLSSFYVFTRMGMIAAWMFVLIALREAGITGWRLLAMRSGKVFSAEKLGKYKTVSQITAIGVILIFIVLRETAAGQSLSSAAVRNWEICISGLMVIAVILTVVSGISYIWNNRGHLYE